VVFKNNKEESEENIFIFS